LIGVLWDREHAIHHLGMAGDGHHTHREQASNELDILRV
jgi:hypothetical protein